MAVIAQTSGVFSSDRAINMTRTALGASDTLTYVDGGGQVLFMYNTTASPVVVTLTGSAPVALTVPGLGGDVTTSAGKAVTVPASGSTYLNLDKIKAYLGGNGTVTVTGGTGVTVALAA